MNRPRILITDDERTIRLTFRLALETDGYDVREAATADDAIACLQDGGFDLAILDLRIAEDSGLNILSEMRRRGLQTPTLMITAYGSIRQAVQAIKLGAIDFLEKPIEPIALRAIVADILDRHQPRPADVAPGSFEDCLREAKRFVNLQQFAQGTAKVAAALELNDKSPEAHNLRGILYEIEGDYDAAKKSYGQAIRLDSAHEAAQQNMRRLFELFNFGSSQEALHLGTTS